MNKHRVTTVTLNAAIDKTYYLPSFSVGQTHRVADVLADAGGKGINAARVIHTLGESVLASGIVGGHNGAFIEQQLTNQKIPHQMLQVAEESRLCLNMVSEAEGMNTELLEPGLTLTEENIASLKELLQKQAASSEIVVLSGSLPAGAPIDLYYHLIKIVEAEGAIAILDTSGEALRAGIQAAPYMIKPNESELAAYLEAEWDAEGSLEQETIIHFIEKTAKQYSISCIAVSLAEKGAIVGYEDVIYKVSPAPIEPINPVGSGDAFVAGFVTGKLRNWEPKQTLKLAAACGASNALHLGAGMVDPNEVKQLMKQIEVTVLQSIQ